MFHRNSSFDQIFTSLGLLVCWDLHWDFVELYLSLHYPYNLYHWITFCVSNLPAIAAMYYNISSTRIYGLHVISYNCMDVQVNLNIPFLMDSYTFVWICVQELSYLKTAQHLSKVREMRQDYPVSFAWPSWCDMDDCCGMFLSPCCNNSNSPQKEACMHWSVFFFLWNPQQSPWFTADFVAVFVFHESRSSPVLPKAKAESAMKSWLQITMAHVFIKTVVSNHRTGGHRCFEIDFPPPLSGTFRVCWCAHYFMGCTQGSHFASWP